MNTTTEQTSELKEFANTLKENGFTVITSKKHPFSTLYFYKNGRFGTVDKDYFGGYNFGTVHKPCRECGTGFSTARETDLTLQNAKESFTAPSWASRSDIAAIRNYTSVEDFINSTNNKWAEYYIL